MVVEVSKSKFIALLVKRLRFRWLADPGIANELVKPFFGRRFAKRSLFVDQIASAYRAGSLPTDQSLRSWLRKNETVKGLFADVDHVLLPQEVVDSVSESRKYRWPVPRVDNLAELADLLTVSSPSIIEWLTLPHRRRNTSVDHYERVSLRKRDGTIRWLEKPRPVLKRVQRVILREVLSRLPLHEATFAFRPGLSIQQCAERHIGRQLVLKMDLCDFFGSIARGRVTSLFAMAGYPPSISRVLSQLCTSPGSIDVDAPRGLRRSRLPQGAPTSPAISNAIGFRMDRRLDGLCRSVDCVYTRYADDLIFSGQLGLAQAKRLAMTVAVIAIEEGFKVHFHKTRFMRHGIRQEVLGLTVNEKLNTNRKEYETMRAILHNAIINGGPSQNRDNHQNFKESLRGRIAQIGAVNANRGKRLMAQFERVNWKEQQAIRGD